MEKEFTPQNKQTAFMNTFLSFINVLIKQLNSVGCYSTARSYRTSIRQLLRFMEVDDIFFSDLTPDLLKRFEQHLFSCRCSRNTVSMYMRMLRSVYNQAVEIGLAPPYPKLFADVFTGNDTTEKRAVSPEVIRRLKEADLSDSPQLEMSRDLFLLSFYLRGIPFVDLARLRKTDLRGGVIRYRRSKTGTLLTVKVEACAQELISRYASRSRHSPFLLRILSREGEAGYMEYQSALRKYNLHLGKISKRLGLNVKLTSYVARHSWATAAYRQGIPVSVICESLGHSSEKVTYTYLASFSNKTLSMANLKVLSLIVSPSRSAKEERRKDRRYGLRGEPLGH